jgi:hypothetical protein
VDAAEFFGLQPTDDPHHWLLPVTPGNLSGLGALFGGCALAAGVEALERSTRRPVVYAAVQFLSFAKPPSVVAIEVIEAVRGYRVSQARACETRYPRTASMTSIATTDGGLAKERNCTAA